MQGVKNNVFAQEEVMRPSSHFNKLSSHSIGLYEEDPIQCSSLSASMTELLILAIMGTAGEFQAMLSLVLFCK